MPVRRTDVMCNLSSREVAMAALWDGVCGLSSDAAPLFLGVVECSRVGMQEGLLAGWTWRPAEGNLSSPWPPPPYATPLLRPGY